MTLGISAVLSAPLQFEAVLDLAAVLEALVGGNFEIVVTACTDGALADLRIAHPNLPLRATETDLVGAISSAQHELVLLVDAAGTLDSYQLNHFLEAIERGADVALGYRAWRFDRLAWSALGHLLFGRTARDVECPFKLFRLSVWRRAAMEPHDMDRWFSTRLVVRARRLGYRVVELPVQSARPTLARRTAAEVKTRVA